MNVKSAFSIESAFLLINKCWSANDATIGKCEYCGTEINPLQEWVLKIETHE